MSLSSVTGPDSCLFRGISHLCQCHACLTTKQTHLEKRTLLVVMIVGICLLTTGLQDVVKRWLSDSIARNDFIKLPRSSTYITMATGSMLWLTHHIPGAKRRINVLTPGKQSHQLFEMNLEALRRK